MLWTTALRRLMRLAYGPLPRRSDGPPSALVLVADGVGGLDLCGTGLAYVAAQEGLRHDVRVVRWGHGFGRWHRDLTSVGNHGRQAGAMADEVRAFHERYPDRPVYLVGKSGGCGIVVRALEELAEHPVERAVLLAPALSPEYDLSRALQAVRTEVVVFWSPLDLVILGLGTRVFGTVDRVASVAAGLTGFRMPAGADRSSYAKLRQVRWRWGMASSGYLGGHVGPDSPRFLRRYVLPLLRPGAESDPLSGRESSSSHSAPIT